MARRPRSTVNWANVLTWTRLILIIPITVAAWLDARWTVLVLFVIAMLTDFFDGLVARRTGVASEKGARLDSAVDNAMLPFYFAWLWLLFPQLFIEFWPGIALLVALIGVQLAVARWKLSKITGLHLWSDKLSAIGGFILLPALIIFGYLPWLVWTVFGISYIASIEGVIYLIKGGKNLDARWMFDK